MTDITPIGKDTSPQKNSNLAKKQVVPVDDHCYSWVNGGRKTPVFNTGRLTGRAEKVQGENLAGIGKSILPR
ncbi:hypothetical protein [Acuticoccus sediminis]|uniref:hypothetical protein n=1 Tax=Acuticoccus sediminis TaxID=2184697 RepID=UPI001CFCD0BE|nr:hypothetical protein [Acuticoccus sediminis]